MVGAGALRGGRLVRQPGRALTLADPASKARFWLLLDSPTPNEHADMREESGVTSAHVP